MQRNKDGSVTLKKSELASLNKAFRALYDIADDGPSYMGDYFDNPRDLRRTQRWYCWLGGKKFIKKDWE